MSSSNWPIRGGSAFWKDPSATFAALPPGGSVGEIRLTLDTGNLYEWDGSAWQLILNASGTVIGPASATDNALVRFDATTGKIIQNGVATEDDTGVITATGFVGPLTGDVTGNVSGTSANVTGVVAIANGGTNSNAILNNNRIMKSSGGAIIEAAAITASKVLVSDVNGIPVAATPSTTEINYVAGVTSAIQTQLDNLAPQLPSVNAWVYVSQQGSDVTGNGSYDKPYATTASALAAITDASASKRYGVHIKGTISEANIYLKPYVWYYGDTWGSSRLNATTSGNIQLQPGSFTTGNSRCGMSNLYLTGSTGINLDYVAESASGSHVIEISALGANGSITNNPANTNQYYQIEGDNLIFGDITLHGALGFIFNTFLLGNLTIDQMATPQATGGVNFANFFVGGNLVHSTSGSFANPVQLTACTVAGNLSVTGTNAVLTADSISLPLEAQVSTATGGAIVRTTDFNSLAGTVRVNQGGTNSVATLNNNRVMKSSGGAIIEAAAITASRALASDANGIPVAATTTATELDFVNGVTSSIQTQLAARALNTRLINTTAPITGGGDLSADRTLAMAKSTAAVDGYLAAADFTIFAAKQAAGNYITALTGDVTASGPGSVAATVALVGGSTAAAVNTATVIANAAYVATSVASVSSNLTLTAQRIHLVDTTSARSETLPSPATTKMLVIKDKTGTASTNNITIVRAGSETIEAVAASYVLDADFGSWTFVSDGTNWWII